MTGYSVNHTLGKKPIFLQGKNTSHERRKKIWEQLQSNIRFKESIKNYRKNGEEYECLLSIIPLENKNSKVTHYLALESKIK